MIHYISSAEVYLPWKDTWLELPPLPDIYQGHRMEITRIFSLNTDSGLRLHLLGGDYGLASGGGRYTRSVYQLQWQDSNSSYYWTDHWDPDMGELHYSHLTTPTYRSLPL